MMEKKRWQIGLLVVMIVFLIPIVIILSLKVLKEEEEEEPKKGLVVRPAKYIKYNPSNESTYLEKYVYPLNNFMKKYEEAKIGDGVIIKCNEETLPGKGENCFFNKLWVYQQCDPENNWNYNTENPCIVLSFENFTSEFEPQPHTLETITKTLETITKEKKDADAVVEAQYIKNLMLEAFYESDGEETFPTVWVSCSNGEHSYTEYSGFPTYFFHNTHLPTYLPPLLGVRLNVGKKFNQDVPIQCKMWAQNINHNEEYGKINFTVHIVK